MEEYKNKRVFVSGAAGVIGREMIPILVNYGAVVMAGDLEPIPDSFPSKIKYRRGDLNYITQEELNEFNPEIFIHLAATFERSTETYEHWEENFWHNVRLSNHLMTLMRNVPALKRVVFPSSYLIYDKKLYNFDQPQENAVRLKETDPINPRNLTGMAKLAHEIELEFLSQFKRDQFTSVCARIYRGYGRNSRDVISRWVRDLLNNKKIFIYRPEGIFDYLYAEDSAKGLLRLGLSNYEGIINLGTGRPRRVSELIDILRQHFPNMEAENVDSDIPYEASQADVTLLQNTLNWVPERDLENTIPDIIEFEKNREVKTEVSLPNVLVTSISKKVPLVTAVKDAVKKISDQPKVYGADIDGDCLGRYFVDEFWLMPALKNLSVDDLIKYCKEQNIGVIIPTRDGELPYFSEAKAALKLAGINVMVSDPKTIDFSLDKLKFAQYNKVANLVIEATEDVDQLNADTFVVKERFGAGSLSIGLNLDKAAAIEHAKTLESPIFQPYVKGEEISIDAYIDQNGEVKGIIPRRRVKVVNGESQITKTFNSDSITSTITDFIKQESFKGHLTFQAFIDEKEKMQLIECNARVGGASMLSIQCGLDTFYWFYLESIGENISNYPFIKSFKDVTQIRYPKDMYL
ncbi:ATP-grasp domain-containing protein [Paracrocinitomix mangrovi]|uniref:NAD-dependent epimerase/dehydratase family protein n=1 Tax=Paracrocinitomix mangrovi TaxID=2862509 RepID=UPI001C8E8417|nr:NAD-dependent epimerase/dehydratase family protein [Paracrocinitomix mangrovi]UKN02778.1 ATP-grasp domain-containing protein [Paracrocinitomix mangrovi]